MVTRSAFFFVFFFLFFVEEKMLSFALALLAVAVVQGQDCSFCGPYENNAQTLPSYVGPSPLPFRSYTGYIEVNKTFERYNFYWHVESQGNPDQDPLVFWYQGGPGCSGLGGLFTEHGPFFADQDGNLDLREFSWNKFANVVYLEQPTAVGFSFSTDDQYNYHTNDQISNQDNFNFLEGFLEAFPQYRNRPTWIAGESYGGVYVPTLGAKIASEPDSQIYKQFAGQMTGNPVFSCDTLKNVKAPSNYLDSQINIFYGHSLISFTVLSQWNDAGCPTNSDSAECIKIFKNAGQQVGQIDQELGDFTFNGTQPSLDPDDWWHNFITGNASLEWVTTTLDSGVIGIDETTSDYLNRADVQSALHVNPAAPVAGEWDFCVGAPLQYTPSGASMIPYYQYVITKRPDVDILVYTGDADIATCPGAETTVCLRELEGTPVEGRSWAPWFVNGATAGYVEQYVEYTYATIKGAGHEAPTYQPLTSFNLFGRFLQNQTLDGGEIYFPPATKSSKHGFMRRQGDVLRSHLGAPSA